MLVIRLARTGRTKYPTYRIVAADSSRAATGRFVAALGHYNPHTKELVVKHEETERYLSNGAQPSNSVIKLLARDGVELPKWAKLKTKAPKKTDEPEVTEEVVAEVPTTEEPAAEEAAPAEEPATETVEEERVGTVAQDAASEAADDVTSPATQETDASEEAQATDAIENEAAADASASEAEPAESDAKKA